MKWENDFKVIKLTKAKYAINYKYIYCKYNCVLEHIYINNNHHNLPLKNLKDYLIQKNRNEEELLHIRVPSKNQKLKNLFLINYPE